MSMLVNDNSILNNTDIKYFDTILRIIPLIKKSESDNNYGYNRLISILGSTCDKINNSLDNKVKLSDKWIEIEEKKLEIKENKSKYKYNSIIEKCFYNWKKNILSIKNNKIAIKMAVDSAIKAKKKQLKLDNKNGEFKLIKKNNNNNEKSFKNPTYRFSPEFIPNKKRLNNLKSPSNEDITTFLSF